MTRGLIGKTIREVWLSTLLYALAMGSFEALLAYMLPMFDERLLGQWLQLEFMQGMFKALLGTEVGSTIGPVATASIAWLHPVVLALVWAQAITFCTRIPAGEVDRGTIDVLFGLPVSRTRVYALESVVWLASGLVLVAIGLLGNLIGGWSLDPQAPLAPGQLIIVVINL